MRFVAILLFLVSINFQLLYGQNTWSKIYNEFPDHHVFAVAQDEEDNFYLAGENDFGAICFKINSIGDVIWFKQLEVDLIGARAKNIEVSSEGKIYISGWGVNSPDNKWKNFFSLLDEHGYILLTNIYENDSKTYYADMCMSSSGNLVCIGSVISDETPDSPDTWIYSINQEGETNWQNIYDLSDGYEQGDLIVSTPDRNLLAVTSFYYFSGSIALTKIDESGEIIWTRIYTREGNGISPKDIIAGIDSQYHIIGEIYSDEKGTRIWVLTLNKDGEILQENEYKLDMRRPSCTAALQKSDSSIVLVGDDSAKRIVLANVDINGELLWQKDFENELKIGVADLKMTNDKGFLIANAVSSTDEPYKMWLLKTDENGNLLNTAVNNHGDTNGNKMASFQSYPNPFNSMVNLEYFLTSPSSIEISIYNITGKKVKTLINSQQTLGRHIVKWDGKDQNKNQLATGIYFAVLKTERNQKAIKLYIIQ